MKPSLAHAAIDRALEREPRKIPPGVAEAYVGGGQSKLEYLGLKVPQMVGVFKAGFDFDTLPDDEVAQIWDFVWHASNRFETMSLALFWFELRKKKDPAALLSHWPLLREWSCRIDNWAHADTLAGIYAAMLEQKPALVYATLKRWGDSPEPWLRRLSIVSLLQYSSQRKKFPTLSKMLPLVEKQIDFDHYYVQKGVGWTLREIGNVYPKETLAFLNKNATRLSATAFTAAVEKLAPRERECIKKMRRKARQKSRTKR